MVRSFRKSCCQPTDTRRSKPPKLKISAETEPAGRCYLAVRSGKFTLVILSGGFYLSPCQTAFAETTQESVKRASDQHSAVDRLTLLLVDRLPTSAERDLTRSFRRQPFVELAGRLTSGPEFFHRQALYWQSQLNNSPAWKWERSQNPYQIDVNAVSPERLSQLLWYVAPSTSSSLARSCGGGLDNCNARRHASALLLRRRHRRPALLGQILLDESLSNNQHGKELRKILGTVLSRG